MKNKYRDEYYKDNFNWNNCTVLNKLDGSLIKVYHDGDEWCTSTNGTAFAEGETPMGKTYHELFVEAIGMDLQEAFEWQLKDFTYIFELTSPENRIVTRYTETKAILLSIRDNIHGNHISHDTLESVINYLPFTELVESYELNKSEDILKFVESRDQMDEGVVCCDNTGLRIKIKNSAYVAIHHLRGNEVTRKSIVTLLLKGEIDEYLSYFPEDFDLIDPFVKRFDQLKSDIFETYDKYKDIKDQKEFALIIKDLEYKSFLFSLRKGVTMDVLLDVNKVGHIVKFFEEV